jgi:GTP cyclohydrolase I
MVASKPQTQEMLTMEILEEIKNKLSPTGIGVVVKAIHTCVFARGVQSNRAEFTTNAMYGKFNDLLQYALLLKMKKSRRQRKAAPSYLRLCFSNSL